MNSFGGYFVYTKVLLDSLLLRGLSPFQGVLYQKIHCTYVSSTFKSMQETSSLKVKQVYDSINCSRGYQLSIRTLEGKTNK